jgi:hypothetical protein
MFSPSLFDVAGIFTSAGWRKQLSQGGNAELRHRAVQRSHNMARHIATAVTKRILPALLDFRA